MAEEDRAAVLDVVRGKDAAADALAEIVADLGLMATAFAPLADTECQKNQGYLAIP